jgi:hypothetical protein
MLELMNVFRLRGTHSPARLCPAEEAPGRHLRSGASWLSRAGPDYLATTSRVFRVSEPFMMTKVHFPALRMVNAFQER